jgi:RHS repeat-associated protein
MWDGENRLVAMTTNNLVGPPYHLTFSYDFQGRRIQKTAMTNGVTIASYNFLYDGWNLVAELNQSDLLARSYVWGTDLSGTPQGASGVGGLLEVTYHGSSVTNCFLAFDGNGNVAALINAADGTVAANYEYAAFGEPIRITGAMAKNNPFRFSTKYDDDESDLLYYGYRYYKPSTGTWPNRDPLTELGFKGITNNCLLPFGREEEKDLYIFVGNNPINNIDLFGLASTGDPSPISVLKDLIDGIKKAWKMAQDGECPKNPCLSTFSPTAVLCNCLYDSYPNLDKMAACVCLASPDTDCSAKAKKRINIMINMP